jgi:hypothetical protein
VDIDSRLIDEADVPIIYDMVKAKLAKGADIYLCPGAMTSSLLIADISLEYNRSAGTFVRLDYKVPAGKLGADHSRDHVQSLDFWQLVNNNGQWELRV